MNLRKESGLSLLLFVVLCAGRRNCDVTMTADVSSSIDKTDDMTVHQDHSPLYSWDMDQIRTYYFGCFWRNIAHVKEHVTGVSSDDLLSRCLNCNKSEMELLTFCRRTDVEITKMENGTYYNVRLASDKTSNHMEVCANNRSWHGLFCLCHGYCSGHFREKSTCVGERECVDVLTCVRICVFLLCVLLDTGILFESLARCCEDSGKPLERFCQKQNQRCTHRSICERDVHREMYTTRNNVVLYVSNCTMFCLELPVKVFNSMTRSDKYEYTEYSSEKVNSALISCYYRIQAQYLSLQETFVYPIIYTIHRYLRRVQEGAVSQEEEMCYEVRRFQSFNSIPVRTSPMRLAQSGFYATGSGDETRCYSCKETHRDWRLMDQPDQIHRSISPDCSHLNRRDERNIPIGSVNSDDNTTVTGILGHYPPTNSSSECTPSQSGATASRAVSESTPASSSQSHPGLDIAKSVYPLYRELSSRLDSYQGWGWSHVQDPQVLARAGFYYAGYRDCVRCFYCGVGLRTWERGDDPWVEHVRWRSSCDYIRVIKGEQFAIQALAQNQNVPSSSLPIVGQPQNSQATLTVDGMGAVTKAEEMGFQKEHVQRAITELRGPESSAGQRNEIPLETLLETLLSEDLQVSSENSSVAPIPGGPVPNESPRMPTSEASGKHPSFHSLTSLLTSTSTSQTAAGQVTENFRKADQGEQKALRCEEKKGNNKAPEGTLSASQERQLEEENQSMRDESTCKICMDNPSCIVFLPCGHLVTCAECAPALRKCPICRAVIRGTVRAYTAST